ncbi:hypothetical protein ACLB2K_014525 [Fragaria x ananassa]
MVTSPFLWLARLLNPRGLEENIFVPGTRVGFPFAAGEEHQRSSQVIAQYYQLIRLGFEGYRNIMENCRENMIVLREGLEKTGRFKIVSKDEGVPLVAFSLKDNHCHDEFEISDLLRRYRWIVPAYTMPADAQHVTVLRVVIREDFSHTLAERLVNDIQKVLHELDRLPSKLSSNSTIETQEVENNEKSTVTTKKSALETQREITTIWRKFVMDKKKITGVC